MKEYDNIIKEHFDYIHDTETRKYLLGIDESDQNKVVSALTSKLYDLIVSKVDKIDYGTIPNSKGDITKVEHYDETVECIDVIRKYLEEYKQDTVYIQHVAKAMENIRSRKAMFQRAFAANVEFIMVSYCNMVLNIEYALHLLITSAIEFIKNPGSESYSISVDKVALTKTAEHLSFRSLIRFNKSCEKGEYDKAMDYIIGQTDKHFVGSATGIFATGVALTIVATNIIPIMRELIYFFFSTRTSISDYFETQADLLQMNAYNVENDPTLNSRTSKSIAKKQMAIVDKFRKIANFTAIDSKQAEKKASKEIANNTRKFKANEVIGEKPQSSDYSDSLF